MAQLCSLCCSSCQVTIWFNLLPVIRQIWIYRFSDGEQERIGATIRNELARRATTSVRDRVFVNRLHFHTATYAVAQRQPLWLSEHKSWAPPQTALKMTQTKRKGKTELKIRTQWVSACRGFINVPEIIICVTRFALIPFNFDLRLLVVAGHFCNYAVALKQDLCLLKFLMTIKFRTAFRVRMTNWIRRNEWVSERENVFWFPD